MLRRYTLALSVLAVLATISLATAEAAKRLDAEQIKAGLLIGRPRIIGHIFPDDVLGERIKLKYSCKLSAHHRDTVGRGIVRRTIPGLSSIVKEQDVAFSR